MKVIHTLIILSTIISMVLSMAILYGCQPSEVIPAQKIIKCSRLADSYSPCPEGYFCYESIAGGNSPAGQVPQESIGGDKICHKICTTDSDCDGRCRTVDILTDDYSEKYQLCFES
ncbi:hypothetical protein JW968_02390 [Candidatus Woesearchaeota archaeon]|nr:hypothetical protein [Candidatus Woesearchaeota archaeon]